MKRRIGMVIIMLTLMVLVSACSKTTETNSGETKVSQTTPIAEEKENKEAIESEAEEASSKEAEQAAVSVEETTYPFNYMDAEGREIAIESQPEKIAISYLPHWEYLIALGQMPVGTTSAEHYANTMDALKGYDLSTVEDLGSTDINLELLTELEPDIILAPMYDSSVENLEQIAPVVVLGEQVKMDWRYGLREIGKIIGKAQVAEEKIAEIDSQIADSRVKLNERYQDQTVMLMSFMGKDRYYCAYRPDLFDEETGLGLNAPKGYPTENSYQQISLETIVEMNPDYLFLAVFDGNEGLYEELKQNSVWNTLKAVQNNHVYVLDGSAHSCSVLSTVYTINSIVDAMLN